MIVVSALKNKSKIMLKAALAVLLPLFLFVAAGSNEARQATLAWTMGLRNVRTGDFIPFSAPVQSDTGEEFQFVVNPEADCYAYLIYEGPGADDLAVLYAGLLKKGVDWNRKF